jgi:hypothetical protein
MIFIILSSFVKAIFKYGSTIVFTTKRSEPPIIHRFCQPGKKHPSEGGTKIIPTHLMNRRKLRLFGNFFLQNLEKQAFTC